MVGKHLAANRFSVSEDQRRYDERSMVRRIGEQIVPTEAGLAATKTNSFLPAARQRGRFFS
jgi:hypothetical protein